MDPETYAREIPHDDHTYSSKVQQRRLREVLRLLGEPRSVLDVGCSDGVPARMMMKGGHDVVAVDISPTRVERARALGVNAQLADAEALPFADGQFSAVVCGEILEHVTNPGLVLSEAARCAAERLIITVPLGGWPDPTHQWRISAKEVSDASGSLMVMGWFRGRCWPEGYHHDDDLWREQFLG